MECMRFVLTKPGIFSPFLREIEKEFFPQEQRSHPGCSQRLILIWVLLLFKPHLSLYCSLTFLALSWLSYLIVSWWAMFFLLLGLCTCYLLCKAVFCHCHMFLPFIFLVQKPSSLGRLSYVPKPELALPLCVLRMPWTYCSCSFPHWLLSCLFKYLFAPPSI